MSTSWSFCHSSFQLCLQWLWRIIGPGVQAYLAAATMPQMDVNQFRRIALIQRTTFTELTFNPCYRSSACFTGSLPKVSHITSGFYVLVNVHLTNISSTPHVLHGNQNVPFQLDIPKALLTSISQGSSLCVHVFVEVRLKSGTAFKFACWTYSLDRQPCTEPASLCLELKQSLLL